jgi:spore germination protein GerM
MIDFSFFKQIRRLSYLILLGCFAFFDASRQDMSRRTFVFYTFDQEKVLVEDRMLPRSASREENIARYVEETLLGPVSLEAAPLFPKGTRLRSLIFRDGTVYGDLSQSAALPVPKTKLDVFAGMLVLNQGIRRNFSYVADVRLFIEGNEAFFKEFADIFGK